jgi:glutaredoxin 3
LNAKNVGIVELDNEADGSAIQEYLQEKTGQRTVPNVFINGKHIGGNSDVQDLLSKGELQKLIEA